MIKTTTLAILLLCLIATVGCGGDGGAAVLKRRSNLHVIGMGYRAFAESNQRGAADASELSSFISQMDSDSETSESQITDAITSLQEGDVVVTWKAPLTDSPENAQYVLAFEAGVPSTGGYVVMADGTVRLMTAKDFSKATMMPTPAGQP